MQRGLSARIDNTAAQIDNTAVLYYLWCTQPFCKRSLLSKPEVFEYLRLVLRCRENGESLTT